MREWMIALLASLWLVGVLPALAGGLDTARQILDQAKQLDDTTRHWDDRHQKMKLTVTSRRGAERVRELEVYDRKYPDGQQKTMVYFSAPDTVKGTAFLAITHPDRPADQWLYLPEARRARRIGGEVRKQGFVGSDFTYDDLDLLAAMPSWTEADAVSTLRGTESIDGVPCYVIELTPQREDIGYQRIMLWLGRDDLIARQVELYETAPSSSWFGGGATTAPSRRIRQSEVRTVGTIPVPYYAEAETPSAGSKTTVTFTDIAFNRGLPDALFSEVALDWGRYEPSTQ